jgi:3-hydroxybutyryl-CoA dehydrogenase
VGAGGPAGGLGPLETGDLIGLDTILFSLEVLYESYNDGKFRPCPLLRKMIDAGLQGRKTGRGFYTYEMAQ